MSELISGKEAKLAWANGEELEIRESGTEQWLKLKESYPLTVFDCNRYELRLKPKTITINGIEVPAPFEPKSGDFFYYLCDDTENSYSSMVADSGARHYSWIAAWRTEEQIKQVVAALRSIFKGE